MQSLLNKNNTHCKTPQYRYLSDNRHNDLKGIENDAKFFSVFMYNPKNIMKMTEIQTALKNAGIVMTKARVKNSIISRGGCYRRLLINGVRTRVIQNISVSPEDKNFSFPDQERQLLIEEKERDDLIIKAKRSQRTLKDLIAE